MQKRDMAKERAPRNRTLTLDRSDLSVLRSSIENALAIRNGNSPLGRTIHGDAMEVLTHIPVRSVNLLLADPPYNLTKTFSNTVFELRPSNEYESWLESWIVLAKQTLTPTASAYICSEWRSSSSVQRILEKHFCVQNRITWEREKGRGALTNWKNCHEDIWFCTVTDKYYFDVEAVKQRRTVIAPYRDADGNPKDWNEGAEGNFRLTHPSNLWTDISVPFWSMPENTDHPTQKPEKLVAKLILASSRPGDVVLDPFLGSGTTSVVAKKLGRQYIGIELEEEYCLLAEKRLAAASLGSEIQGYSSGYFWDRNTHSLQQKQDRQSLQSPALSANQPNLFENRK